MPSIDHAIVLNAMTRKTPYAGKRSILLMFLLCLSLYLRLPCVHSSFFRLRFFLSFLLSKVQRQRAMESIVTVSLSPPPPYKDEKQHCSNIPRIHVEFCFFSRAYTPAIDTNSNVVIRARTKPKLCSPLPSWDE